MQRFRVCLVDGPPPRQRTHGSGARGAHVNDAARHARDEPHVRPVDRVANGRRVSRGALRHRRRRERRRADCAPRADGVAPAAAPGERVHRVLRGDRRAPSRRRPPRPHCANAAAAVAVGGRGGDGGRGTAPPLFGVGRVAHGARRGTRRVQLGVDGRGGRRGARRSAKPKTGPQRGWTRRPTWPTPSLPSGIPQRRRRTARSPPRSRHRGKRRPRRRAPRKASASRSRAMPKPWRWPSSQMLVRRSRRACTRMRVGR